MTVMARNCPQCDGGLGLESVQQRVYLRNGKLEDWECETSQRCEHCGQVYVAISRHRFGLWHIVKTFYGPAEAVARERASVAA